MAQSVLFYLVGPPIEWDGDQQGIVKQILEKVASQPLRHFQVQFVDAPLTIFEEQESLYANIRSGLIVSDLYCGVARWEGVPLSLTDFSVLGQCLRGLGSWVHYSQFWLILSIGNSMTFVVNSAALFPIPL